MIGKDWTTRQVDLVERGLVLLVSVVGTALLVPALRSGPMLGDLLVLAANGVVAIFVVIRRRPQEISVRPSDWTLAIGGTVAPLFDRSPHGPHLLSPAAAVSMTLLGLSISLVAKLALRRSFSIVPARAEIVSRGPYRFVRHPMYSGYLLTHLGILSFGFTWWNLLCYATCWAFLWPRMRREEALLTHDEMYRSYCAQVRYRLVWGLV